MRSVLWVTPLLTAAACFWAYRENKTDFGVALAVGVLAVAVAFAYALRAFTRHRQWVATHTLFVTDRGLLFQDGLTELSVPFESVTSLAVKRRGSRVRALILKYDSHREILGRYEDLEVLAQLLVARIPPDRVTEFAWFHV